MPIVKVGDQRIKFPDSMSQEEIGSVLQKQFGQPKKEIGQPNIFEGLPQETVQMIEQKHPLRRTAPTAASVGMALGGLQPREVLDPLAEQEVMKARKLDAELERIRIDNPYLAQQIEETGGMEAFLVGAGRGLTTIGRGLGLAEQEDPLTKQALDQASARSGALAAGEIVGESAPFLAVSPVAAVPRTLAGRTAATSALTGAEGATIAKGKGAEGADVVKAGLLASALGGVAELAAPIARRIVNIKEVTDAGAKLLKEPTRREVAKGLAEAAPTAEQLKDASRNIYQGIEDLGIKVRPEAIDALLKKARMSASGLGFVDTKAGRKQMSSSSNIIELIDDIKDLDPGVKEIELVRRNAQEAASEAFRAGRNQDSKIAGEIVDDIDTFLGSISTKDMTGEAINVGKDLAVARKLWGRARKDEMLQEALERAKTQASGLENGIRRQFDQILKNKKKSAFLNKSDKEAMQVVVSGTKGANFFRKVGRLGFGRGQQHTMTNAILGQFGGAGVGSAVGGPLGAGVGAVLLPTVGSVSSILAENLTKKNAAMASAILRAGADAEKITKAYMSRTPKSQQNVDDLTALLVRGDIDLDKAVQPIAIEAARKARELRLAAPAAAIAVPAAAEEE